MRLLLILGIMTCGPAWALNWQEEFAAIKNDLKTYMAKPPEKYMDKSLSIVSEAARFSSLAEKRAVAKACRPSVNYPQAKTLGQNFEEGDEWEIEYFLGAGVASNILDTDEWRSAQVDVEPWSGDYWPIAKGVLAARVFDDAFSTLTDWISRFMYQSHNPAFMIFEAAEPEELKRLSVAEKYDLIVGPENSDLTSHMWDEGRRYHEQYGEVASWMGICHGWAIASYMMKTPKWGVTTKSYDGKKDIYLYPDEIKGLASYLWANNSYEYSFVGRRCNVESPERDENGRIIDRRCFDANPATWHLAATHLIGKEKTSFVMDVTYDYEVWNQPVHSYSFEYFNVATGERTTDLDSAVLPIGDIEDDKFKKYRSPRAKSLVGVAMTVGYVVETESLPNDDIQFERARLNWVRYVYDLELDADGKIIGGEWYSNYHPDFLYRAQEDAKPMTLFEGDLNLADWKPHESLPYDWKAAAAESSERGQVLYNVVQRLLKASRKEPL